MGREEAVKHTVDTCIREGILRDFLLKYREEAIEMCIFEYDEEETLRQLGQQSYEEGRSEAFAPEYDWKAVYEACVRQKIG